MVLGSDRFDHSCDADDFMGENRMDIVMSTTWNLFTNRDQKFETIRANKRT
jgi:hypothetical protein